MATPSADIPLGAVNYDTIIALRDAVLLKRPVLKEIMEKRGHKTLFQYAGEYIDVNLNDHVRARQAECVGTFRNEVASRLGDEIANEASEQLARYYFVSTADHHGPLCHPFFLNSHLVSSITCSDQDQKNWKYIIALSCANVSFANSSFPRGLLFHGRGEAGAGKIQQVGFFPNSSAVRQARVFGYRGYNRDDANKVLSRLDELKNSGELASEHHTKLKEIVNDIYLRPDILATESYSDQITKTNFLLWRRLFQALGSPGRDLLYIELESMVTNLLLDHHINKNTTLHRILFKSEYRESFLRHFDNIEGGFSLLKGWGTYLFWALPPGSKYCKRVHHDNGYLVTDDGSYRLEMTPENIAAALVAKEIFPSTQLSLLVLSLYYGLKCLGGFCQVNYLTYMKDAYTAMLTEQGDLESIAACESVQTKELGEDLCIAFLGSPNGAQELATTLDLILYGNPESWNYLLSQVKQINLTEALMPMMPEFHRIMYLETERDQLLSSITPDHVMEHLGLKEKIKPCVFLN